MSTGIPFLKQRNQYVLVIIIILAIFIFFGLERIVGSFLGATIFYVIFRPLNIYLQEKKKWNKGLSAALIMVLSFVCMVIPIFLIVQMLTNRVMFYVNHPDITNTMLKNVNAFAAEKLHDPELINRFLATLKTNASGFVSSILNASASTFVQIIIMYFTLYYILKNFRSFESGLVHYLPFKTNDTYLIGMELRNMTYSNVLGQGFIAIIQGTLLGIGFLIFGLSDPFFWGIVGIFLSMIPLFGTPFLFVPAGLIAISNGNIGAGIGIILYGYLLVTMIDNFIRMAIGRKIANTHPLITIIGVVIGFPLFGIMGILYGPLLLSLFIILAKIYRTNITQIIQLEKVKEDNAAEKN